MPPEFVEAQADYANSRRRPWNHPLVLAGWFAAILFQWWFQSYRRGENFPVLKSAADALIAALITAYAYRKIRELAGRHQVCSVVLKDSGVRIYGEGIKRCAYSSVRNFEWRVNPTFATLALHTTLGEPPLLIGVPLDISRDTISQFLIEKGIAPKTP